jgi:hypothetical protein
MGEVIHAGAAIEDIEADVRTTHERATARGGEVATAATERLATSVAAMDSAKQIHDGAKTAESAGWTVVLARDEDADLAIGSVRDEMWNALGRPRQSPAMDHAFPGGVGTYAGGDPLGQPVLMEVLATRIRSAEAAQWTAAARDGWVARIEAARAPLHAAAQAYQPLDAALRVAEAGRRAAIRAGHARLVSFKRDLKNHGLNEAQIHEIIPDRPKPRKPAPQDPPA